MRVSPDYTSARLMSTSQRLPASHCIDFRRAGRLGTCQNMHRRRESCSSSITSSTTTPLTGVSEQGKERGGRQREAGHQLRRDHEAGPAVPWRHV